MVGQTLLVFTHSLVFIYALTFTPNPLYALWIKNGIAHTAYQSNIQATLSFIKLHWAGGFQNKLANTEQKMRSV